MIMSLDIVIAKGNTDNYRVKLSGTLDDETADELDRRMIEVWADDNARVIRMELHDLKFISSAGLGMLARIKKAITNKGGVMVTIGAQPQIVRVFDIVKMLPKETVFTSREEADEYLAAIQHRVIEEERQAS